MPLYEYACSACKEEFELLRPLPERDEPCECPHCRHEGKMNRLSSLFASQSGGAGKGAAASGCTPSSSGFG